VRCGQSWTRRLARNSGKRGRARSPLRVPVLAPQPHSRCSLLVEQVSLAECTAAGASSTHGPRSVVGTLVGRGRSTRANYSSVTDDAHLWEATLGFLRSLHHLPGALATAALLKSVRNDWEDRVIARTSMHDLLLTLPNQGFPWEADVRVSARGVTLSSRFTARKEWWPPTIVERRTALPICGLSWSNSSLKARS
jgi:hypothetical protein